MNHDKDAEWPRAWVDIDLEALVRNARAYQDCVGSPLLPMVKADGYGLGAAAVAATLARQVKPWGFGVATLDEALSLRRSSIAHPIIVFSPLVTPLAIPTASAGVRPVIADVAALQAWLAVSPGPFHLEIDTGMSRSGIRWDDTEALTAVRNLVADSPGWEGAFTHFHSAENNPESTERQWTRLHTALDALGRRPRLVHAANSAAARYGTRYGGDLARPGIHLYGGGVTGLNAEPVARLRTRVVALRRLDPGDTVSYDATWRAVQSTTIATLAIGYADGVPRHLSNAGIVEVNQERLPIVGRVTMDHLMVDAGELSVAIGDVATLFGGRVSLDEQARAAGTISYELLTGLGARVTCRYQGV